MTGAFNRHYFSSQLTSELAYAARHGQPLSVILLDIDFFKKVNDTYGHLGGDAALVHVSRVFGKSLRTEDLLARYGGEEFGLIMPGTGKAEGQLTAERLRARVEAFVFADATTQPGGRLTISAGVAAVPQDGVILEHLGDVLHALGEGERAREMWARALQIRPDTESLRDKLSVRGRVE